MLDRLYSSSSLFEMFHSLQQEMELECVSHVQLAH